jgi:hypothetical protein
MINLKRMCCLCACCARICWDRAIPTLCKKFWLVKKENLYGIDMQPAWFRRDSYTVV